MKSMLDLYRSMFLKFIFFTNGVAVGDLGAKIVPKLPQQHFLGVINAIEAVIADVSVDGLIPVEALSLLLAVEAGVYSPSDVFGKQLHGGVKGHRYILWV